jgi:hypothetical protein
VLHGLKDISRIVRHIEALQEFEVWLLPHENVKMVRHVIDRYQLLTLSRYDAGYVFLKLIVMLWPD